MVKFSNELALSLGPQLMCLSAIQLFRIFYQLFPLNFISENLQVIQSAQSITVKMNHTCYTHDIHLFLQEGMKGENKECLVTLLCRNFGKETGQVVALVHFRNKGTKIITSLLFKYCFESRWRRIIKERGSSLIIDLNGNKKDMYQFSHLFHDFLLESNNSFELARQRPRELIVDNLD